jgi:transcription antitermination protein NusB
VLLYQRDVTGLSLEELERNMAREGELLDPFARELVEAVGADTDSLDRLITEAAEGWTAERIAPLERNILRVSVHELLDREDIPVAVSISEAVGMAKRFCGAEAPAFVNGILGRIAAEHADHVRGT